MWSPIEKTALAEAEVEYHEKTSPTIYVKFPVWSVRERTANEVEVRSAGALAAAGLGGRRGRDLDDDALDDSGQPRDRLFADHVIRPL